MSSPSHVAYEVGIAFLVLGALGGLLPKLGALMGVLWYGVQLYEWGMGKWRRKS